MSTPTVSTRSDVGQLLQRADYAEGALDQAQQEIARLTSERDSVRAMWGLGFGLGIVIGVVVAALIIGSYRTMKGA